MTSNVLVQTITKQVAIVNNCLREAKEVRKSLINLKRDLDGMKAAHTNSPQIKTDLNIKYGYIEGRADNIKTLLDTVIWQWAPEFRVGICPARQYDHASIDVDGGGTTGKITSLGIKNIAINVDWDDIFEADDVVSITSRENSDTPEDYIVSAATASLLTLTQVLTGTDNTEDKSLVIAMKEDDDDTTPA